VIAQTPALRRALDAVAAGVFSPEDRGRYAGLCDAVWNSDYFLVTSDFASYWDAQRRVDDLWRDRTLWRRMGMLNTARMGWFSSDRTIREYAEEIWKVPHSRTHG
jgi:starch phosphorylase